MTLKDCIEDYLQYILHEQGLSKATHRGYRAQLRHFLTWLDTQGYTDPNTDLLTIAICRKFLYYLSGKGLRPRTIHSYFDPLDGLCTFLMDNDGLAENPVKSLKLPKKDQARRATLSDEQVQKLFDACDRCRSPRTAAQRRAILSVLAYAGLRRSELCDLQVSDVNLSDKSVTVRCGKGAKGRAIYLCQDAVAALRHWLTLRGECNHLYLFAVDKNRRVHHEAITNLMKELKTLADLRDCDAVSPHSIRHWSGTHLLRQGADIRSVQAFLGHSQLATTAIYLHADEARLRDVAELTALRPATSPPDPTPKAEESSNMPRFRTVARNDHDERRLSRRSSC